MRPKAGILLKECKSTAYLCTNPLDIRYLTGVKLSEGLLLIGKNGYTLFVDGRYTEIAKDNALKGVKVRGIDDVERNMKKIRRCSFDEEAVSVARLKRWKKKFKTTSFKPIKNPVEIFRRVKDAAEIKALKKALRMTDEILHMIPKALKPGITERELSWKIESWAHEKGAEKMSFETIVAFGPYSSRPHHRPTDKKLKKGEIVQIDMGVVIDGYHADRSEVYFTASPSKKEAEIYSAVHEAKEAAIKAIKAGVEAAKVDQIARDVLKKYNLEQFFTHSLGHGVGLEIHEGINLSGRSTQTILEHEVVTVEPGVYLPGKFGMRLEDMVFVRR